MEKFLYQRLDKKTPKINLWFAYGAVESFAMASLGYLSIFKDFDLDPEIFVERVYSNTTSTQLTAQQVHAMGFSVSFELDILTIIKMLDKYGFAPKSSDRKEHDPLIFAGGPVLMANPAPFEEFFDFISIGEKSCLKNAFEVIKNGVDKKRDEVLKELSNVEGIYVPKYRKLVKIVRDNIKQDVIYTPILSEKSYFKDTFIVELERGCPKMCNFCLASWLNLPVRFVDYEKIIEAIDFGIQHTNKIALLGAYVAGHPRFDDIIKHISNICKTKELELSISSLRADLTDIELIKTLVQCNQKTATIALEAGSQRLRNLIQKDLSQEQILNTVKTAKLGGLKGLKIYVMIGLPTETKEDLDELINLAKQMKDTVKKEGGGFDITLSASTFIPKSHTPFELVERLDKKTLEQRISYLKKNLYKIGVNFKTPSIDWDIIQAILSRYDKSLADFLIEVTQKGANLGAFKQTWRKLSKEGKLMPFEQAQKLPFEKPRWGFIDTGAMELKNRRMEKPGL